MSEIEITDADRAIADKAWRIWEAKRRPGGYIAGYAYAAALARTGWTPEPEVDPDLLEAREIAAQLNPDWGHECIVEQIAAGDLNNDEVQCALAGIKRGRELAAQETAGPAFFDALATVSALNRAEQMIQVAKGLVTKPEGAA